MQSFTARISLLSASGAFSWGEDDEVLLSIVNLPFVLAYIEYVATHLFTVMC